MVSSMSGSASRLRAQRRRPLLIRMGGATYRLHMSFPRAFRVTEMRIGVRSVGLARRASTGRSRVSDGLRYALNDSSISTRSNVDACTFILCERANVQLARDTRPVVGPRIAGSRLERHDRYERRRM